MYTISDEKLFVTWTGNTVQRVSVFAGNRPDDLNSVSMTHIVGKKQTLITFSSHYHVTYTDITPTHAHRNIKQMQKNVQQIIYHS